MLFPGVKTPYKCSGIVIHQTSSFNFFENVQYQINSFPCWQYECCFVPHENGRGTQKKEMIAIYKEIWAFALSKGIMITAEYLPGRLNVRADLAFRNFQNSSKWLLSPRVFEETCVKWGFLELDLLASWACHQIPSYLSWKAHPHSLVTYAFQQS